MILQTPPIWMDDMKGFVQDTVKVVLHVQAQKHWEANFEIDESKLKIVPLTRPYGLLPGMTFQAQLLSRYPVSKRGSA